MFARCLFILCAVCAMFTTSARAQTPDPVVPAELLLKLRSTADLQPVLSQFGLTLADRLGPRPIYRVKPLGVVDLDALAAAMRLDSRVLIAEPNVVTSSPEARLRTVWAIGTEAEYRAQWAPEALNLALAHRFGKGAGRRIAVLDTGIDRNHPALAGRVLRGYDFVDGDNDPSEVVLAGSPAYGHGTHVAGIVSLVAPAAKLMPVRVLDPEGRGNVWVIGKALMFAVDPDANPATNNGAHVVNMSLGTTRKTRMLDVFVELVTCSDDDDDEEDDDYSDPGYDADRARCAATGGTVVTAAAGNSGSSTELQYPAAEGAAGALSVAASTELNRLADFSNSGNWIQIAAPGEGITGPLPGGLYGVWSGTSMAAPMAAGVAALVGARQRDLKAVDVAKRLTDRSADTCGATIRRLDAAAAVRNLAPPPTTCP